METKSETYLTRMLTEFETLTVNIDRAKKYIVSKTGAPVTADDSADLKLLEEQYNAMVHYKDILRIRLNKKLNNN